jgi:hypothetical protein
LSENLILPDMVIQLNVKFCDIFKYLLIVETFVQGIRGCIQKLPDWPPVARTANGKALCH